MNIDERLAQIERVYKEGYGYFMRPHWLQLPIWISSDAADLVRWAMTQPTGRQGTALTREIREPGFSEREALAFFSSDSDDAETQRANRESMKEVVAELSRANLIGDGGWGVWRLRLPIVDAVVNPDPPPTIELAWHKERTA